MNRSRIISAFFASLVVTLLSAQVRAAEPGDKDILVLEAMSRAISKVAGEASPSVVSIYTTRMVRMPAMPDVPQLPPMFEEFFRQRPGPAPEQREFRSRGLGSGFIFDAKRGYILTNNHVVDGAEDIKIRLWNKEVYDGKVIGSDRKTDIAVVQIKIDGLKEIKLGDSDKMSVGDFVMAIGSPFGLTHTVSTGIVSAVGRSNLGIEDYEDFIQTDAAINMGNSGGPLVNLYGEAVGVSTAIVSRTGGSVGVGFAIPINMVKEVVKQLVETGKVTRGWLGVQIQDLTPEMTESFGLKKAEGALVSQVIDETPAAEAGVKAGDVIVEYGGQKVDNVTKLRSMVAMTEPGAKKEIVVLREGKRKALDVKVGTLPETVAVAKAAEGESKKLGLTVQDLTPDLAKNLGVEVKHGVAVTEVDASGPAAGKDISPGDVITEVNREPVKNTADFEAAIKKADLKKGVLLLLTTRQGNRFVVLKAE